MRFPPSACYQKPQLCFCAVIRKNNKYCPHEWVWNAVWTCHAHQLKYANSQSFQWRNVRSGHCVTCESSFLNSLSLLVKQSPTYSQMMMKLLTLTASRQSKKETDTTKEVENKKRKLAAKWRNFLLKFHSNRYSVPKLTFRNLHGEDELKIAFLISHHLFTSTWNRLSSFVRKFYLILQPFQ